MKTAKKVPAAVTAKVRVAAAPKAVFAALASAWDWQGWLCESAEMEARVGGAWRATWMGGYEASGRVTEILPGRRFSLSWVDENSPRGAAVTFALTPDGAGTVVRVRHSGFAAGRRGEAARAAAKAAWAPALQALRSHVKDGIDLRLARRPMLGVGLDLVSAEQAADLGVAPGSVRIHAVVPGGGAGKAGVRAGDILLSLDGKPVAGYEEVAPILARRKAMDPVKVVVLRDGRRETLTVVLGGRPVPKIPADPAEVVARTRAAYADLWRDFESLLAGVGEEEVAVPEAPGKWSVKQVLAHLSVAERWNHAWIACDIEGEVIHGMRENPTITGERLAAAIAVAGTVAGLFARYKVDVEESIRLFMAMRPEVRRNRARYRRIAEALSHFAEHGRTHLAQVERILAAVRAR